jgi:hypothetical protein
MVVVVGGESHHKSGLCQVSRGSNEPARLSRRGGRAGPGGGRPPRARRRRGGRASQGVCGKQQRWSSVSRGGKDGLVSAQLEARASSPLPPSTARGGGAAARRRGARARRGGGRRRGGAAAWPGGRRGARGRGRGAGRGRGGAAARGLFLCAVVGRWWRGREGGRVCESESAPSGGGSDGGGGARCCATERAASAAGAGGAGLALSFARPPRAARSPRGYVCPPPRRACAPGAGSLWSPITRRPALSRRPVVARARQKPVGGQRPPLGQTGHAPSLSLSLSLQARPS